ncbi:MAG: tetratricopeptide repeat protein [bacterium]|nr:MAG: tetratricopeptide repeat protein [bacterium]
MKKYYQIIPSFVIFYTFLFFLTCSSSKNESASRDREPPAFLYYKKSMSAIENQNYQRALSFLDTAIALKPEVSQFYYARGQIYELTGEKLSALKSYETALSYKSHFPDCWEKLALLYLEFRKPDKAAQMLRYLTEDQPDSLQFELLLADAYLADHKPLLTLERLNYYDKKGGSSEETFRIRGLTYYQQGNYPEAIKYLDQYVNKKQLNFEAQKYLGIACLKEDLPEKGISHLNQALRMDSEDAELYIYRARYFLSMKKVETAIEQFNLALKMDDTNSVVLLEVSKFSLNQGDTTRAETLLHKALAEDKNCWECYKSLGIIAESQNRLDQAYDYLQKYISNIYFRDLEVEKLLEKLDYLRQN